MTPPQSQNKKILNRELEQQQKKNIITYMVQTNKQKMKKTIEVRISLEYLQRGKGTWTFPSNYA